MRILD